MENTIDIQYLEGLNNGPIKLGLENITELMKRLGNPEESLKIIHIGGTNGKGSVSQMISSILQRAGYKVGVFNSPHLIIPEECIRINNQDISMPKFNDYIRRLKSTIEALQEEGFWVSYFEALTALGLLYFKEEAVDFVILEVGLGGRLDATNVIKKTIASVLTKIAIDHKDFLGDTLEAITKQKAGIIKPSGLVITPLQAVSINQVIRQTCKEMKAELIEMEPSLVEVISVSEEGTLYQFEDNLYKLQLIGAHQAYNGSLALTVIKVLREKGIIQITWQQIEEGLAQARWQGRFEKVHTCPTVFIDGAHNVDGIKALAATLGCLPPAYRIGIVGILRDKEVDEMLESIVPQFDYLIVTEPQNMRAMKAEELAKKLSTYQVHAEVVTSIEKAVTCALELARWQKESQIIAFGSLYMIGEVKQLLKETKK